MTTTNLSARRAASTPTYYYQPSGPSVRTTPRRSGVGTVVPVILKAIGIALVVALFAGLMLTLSTA